jgi:hypothetical protein
MGADQGQDGSPQLIRQPPATGSAAFAGYETVGTLLGYGGTQSLNLADAEIQNPGGFNLCQSAFSNSRDDAESI